MFGCKPVCNTSSQRTHFNQSKYVEITSKCDWQGDWCPTGVFSLWRTRDWGFTLTFSINNQNTTQAISTTITWKLIYHGVTAIKVYYFGFGFSEIVTLVQEL